MIVVLSFGVIQISSNGSPEQKGPMEDSMVYQPIGNTDESWPNGNKGQICFFGWVSIAVRSEGFRTGKYLCIYLKPNNKV